MADSWLLWMSVFLFDPTDEIELVALCCHCSYPMCLRVHQKSICCLSLDPINCQKDAIFPYRKKRHHFLGCTCRWRTIWLSRRFSNILKYNKKTIICWSTSWVLTETRLRYKKMKSYTILISLQKTKMFFFSVRYWTCLARQTLRQKSKL